MPDTLPHNAQRRQDRPGRQSLCQGKAAGVPATVRLDPEQREPITMLDFGGRPRRGYAARTLGPLASDAGTARAGSTGITPILGEGRSRNALSAIPARTASYRNMSVRAAFGPSASTAILFHRSRC
jgi:hypothetical protein